MNTYNSSTYLSDIYNVTLSARIGISTFYGTQFSFFDSIFLIDKVHNIVLAPDMVLLRVLLQVFKC
jgi:hypothetical protein